MNTLWIHPAAARKTASTINTEAQQFLAEQTPWGNAFRLRPCEPPEQDIISYIDDARRRGACLLRVPDAFLPLGPNICSSRTRLWTAPRAARALRQRQTSHGTCTCHKDRMRQRQGHCLCEAPARTSSHGGKARTPGRSLRCSAVALSHNLYSVRARRSMLTSPLRHAVPPSQL